MEFPASVWIGFDHREAQAFAVCRHSIKRRLTQQIPVKGLVLSDLERMGIYKRPWEKRDNGLWDVISEAPMSTEFAVSRFLTPLLAKTGWAVYMDADLLARCSLARLFELANPKYAVMCVKHNHNPEGQLVKKEGQQQTAYARKNWSSMMMFNVDHPANKKLTHDMVNTVPGRDLHRFCWLEDDEIGALDPAWNYLVGITKIDHEPNLVHFTLGVPFMAGYEHCEYADEYRRELELWAAA